MNNTQSRVDYALNKRYVTKFTKTSVDLSNEKRQLRGISEAYKEVKNFYKVLYVSRVVLGLSVPVYLKHYQRLSSFTFGLNSHSRYERLEYVVASGYKLRLHYLVMRLLSCPTPSGASHSASYLDNREYPVKDNLLFSADFDFFDWQKGIVTFGLNPDFPQYHGRNFSDIYAEMRPDIMAIQNGEEKDYDGRSVKSGMKSLPNEGV